MHIMWLYTHTYIYCILGSTTTSNATCTVPSITGGLCELTQCHVDLEHKLRNIKCSNRDAY